MFGKQKVSGTRELDAEVIPIGAPAVSGHEILVGQDALGEVECKLTLSEDGHLRYQFGRAIMTGTNLVFKPNFKEEESFFRSPYLDNRIGIYNLLKLAENIENGAIVFSCFEENGGGSVPNLVRLLYEKYAIKKMLVSDVTWASDGVHLNNGVVVSFRDRNIPRKSYVNEIVNLAKYHDIPFQIEVEAGGSSDGREIQMSPYPIDWCFVGPPIEHMHSDNEKIAKDDLQTMLKFYELLMQNL